MIYILLIVTISYMVVLFKKKYPISLSMVWVVIFFAIYVLVPLGKNYISELNKISDETVTLAARYSLIGLTSFVTTNGFFLLKWKKLERVSINKLTEINDRNTKKLLYVLIFIAVVLLIITIGVEGIGQIFSLGSRSLWLGDNHNGIFATFAELSFFYINIVGSVFLLSSSEDNREKSRNIFIILIVITSIMSFARRHVIYPIGAIVLYKLSQNVKKGKVLIWGAILVPMSFVAMYVMGYMRTFGISNISLEMMVDYFKNGNFIDIFMSNTDFGASYKYFANQIEVGSIEVSPLGYFKALFTIIPRDFWPEKPAYTSVQILTLLEPEKVRAGFSAATGYLGEAHATLGIGGIILISNIWGLVCAIFDKKYQFIATKRKLYKEKYNIILSITVFEFYYLYTGILLIMESHRGDFGAASLHFVLEIVLIGVIIKWISKRYSKRKKRIDYYNMNN